MILNLLNSKHLTHQPRDWMAWLLCLLLLLLVSSLAMAADQAGQFQFVHGQVQVERQ
ncbi:MAG: hypothetical protein IBX50_19550 [Marinospirillum sp.]|uniref:hypothetical protein n=1 Tax=Marinospirillum sp. TaxID=2183934 RepID=UPI0019E25B1F|nr:hypothetical protein [Marinospirillum sp.]MBE0508886.1 hypothetical protein [Marinospirillum sp.]